MKKFNVAQAETLEDVNSGVFDIISIDSVSLHGAQMIIDSQNGLGFFTWMIEVK